MHQVISNMCSRAPIVLYYMQKTRCTFHIISFYRIVGKTLKNIVVEVQKKNTFFYYWKVFFFTILPYLFNLNGILDVMKIYGIEIRMWTIYITN